MSTIKAETLSTLGGSYSVPTETLARGACRAWVNFNGTGTVAIRASFNVSSITDNAVGDYTVNFTTAMEDANYATACGGVADNNSTGSFGWKTNLVGRSGGSSQTGSVRVGATNLAGALTDLAEMTVAIFR